MIPARRVPGYRHRVRVGVAVALTMERPAWERIHALETGVTRQLTIARTNAQNQRRNGYLSSGRPAELRIHCSRSHGTSSCCQSPRISHHDESSRRWNRRVRDHEPKLALFANNRQGSLQKHRLVYARKNNAAGRPVVLGTADREQPPG